MQKIKILVGKLGVIALKAYKKAAILLKGLFLRFFCDGETGGADITDTAPAQGKTVSSQDAATPPSATTPAAGSKPTTTNPSASNTTSGKKAPMQKRYFHIVTAVVHPVTGQPIMDEAKLKAIIKKYSSIKKWAYILHDQDLYTADDAVKDPSHKAGSVKPAHWHIYIYVPNKTTVDAVARWFGVLPNLIDLPYGKDAEARLLKYFTHSESEHKKRYPDEAVHANFDWRAVVERYDTAKTNCSSALSVRDKNRHAVLMEGKTLAQCRTENPLAYAADEQKLRKLRSEYLSFNQPLPELRLNYYIYGAGGTGKSSLSAVLAECLGDKLFADLPFQDRYFSTGSAGVPLDGYEGQPIVIWDDRRATSFLEDFGGAENVFRLIDPYPKSITGRSSLNVKYGHTTVNNCINIVNGVEPFEDFITGLCQKYRDSSGFIHEAENNAKEQAYRRFPLVIHVHANDILFEANKGFLESSQDYCTYQKYAQTQGSVKRVIEVADQELQKKLLAKMLDPAIQFWDEVKNKSVHKIGRIEDLPDEFRNYGENIVSANQGGAQTPEETDPLPEDGDSVSKGVPLQLQERLPFC